jgi:UDP-3-O-[3-hydroxymyristoyl] glucosamine N-acyltransferase
MKFDRTQELADIAAIIGCDYVGEPDYPVKGMNEIHVVDPGDIVFVDHPKYYEKALASRASVILINKEVECPRGKALLISERPFDDFNRLANHFYNLTPVHQLKSEKANIHPSAHIEPNVLIDNEVEIGKNCLIQSNVVIRGKVSIGDNVILQSGVVLGGSAFYYKKKSTGYDALRSTGSIIIEDNVEIGPNTTIDRGVSGQTFIGKGTKIDNQVQIGHDTKIGKYCLIAAQAGIAGCVNVEDEVTIWGQVGIASGLTIGEKATLLACSGISKSVESNATYFGTPAGNIRTKYRELASLAKLPDIMKNIKKISHGK